MTPQNQLPLKAVRPLVRFASLPRRVLDIVCQCPTMSSMRTAKTVSITLPPDLLVKAQALAEREHRTISELFREALRHYIARDPDWESLLKRTRAAGATLGIGDEAQVERLSDEYRREKY
jgi:predicted transcriptional regulator